jgi:hypothetical protein
MPDLVTAVGDLLAAVRQSRPTDPAAYGNVSKACNKVRPFLLDPKNPNVPAPGLPARLLELLERIDHPGPFWFHTRTALAVELLTAALAELVGPSAARKPTKVEIALGILMQNRHLSIPQLARLAGCNRTTLDRSAKFMRWWDANQKTLAGECEPVGPSRSAEMDEYEGR